MSPNVTTNSMERKHHFQKYSQDICKHDDVDTYPGKLGKYHNQIDLGQNNYPNLPLPLLRTRADSPEHWNKDDYREHVYSEFVIQFTQSER